MISDVEQDLVMILREYAKDKGIPMECLPSILLITAERLRMLNTANDLKNKDLISKIMGDF